MTSVAISLVMSETTKTILRWEKKRQNVVNGHGGDEDHDQGGDDQVGFEDQEAHTEEDEVEDEVESADAQIVPAIEVHGHDVQASAGTQGAQDDAATAAADDSRGDGRVELVLDGEFDLDEFQGDGGDGHGVQAVEEKTVGYLAPAQDEEGNVQDEEGQRGREAAPGVIGYEYRPEQAPAEQAVGDDQGIGSQGKNGRPQSEEEKIPSYGIGEAAAAHPFYSC